MRCWMAAVITDGVKDQLQASTRGAISSCGHATYPDAHPARRRAPPTSCPRPDRPLTPFRDRAVVELHDVRGRRTRLWNPTAHCDIPPTAGRQWQEEPDRSRRVPDLRG